MRATPELFERASAALAAIGIASDSEWAEQLRHFVKFERCSDRLLGYEEYVKDIHDKVETIERQEHERTHRARVSQHLGTIGERIAIIARVAFVKTFPPKEDDDASFERHLTILNDETGNVVKYWNTINLSAPTEADLKAKRPAVKGERVSFSAKVIAHETYKEVKQTLVQRATKPKLA